LPQAVQYHLCYPDQPGFQFWRDRMVTFEHFGMRWCIVIYGPLNDKTAHDILDTAVVKVMIVAYYFSSKNRDLAEMLNLVLSYTNDELIECKERDNINIFHGIGIAVTVVDSEGRMAYAQGGDAIVLLCHQQQRRAQHQSDIIKFTEYNYIEKLQPRRNFGTHRTWQGYVSQVFILEPGDVWFISTEGNFLLMHDQVPDEVVYELNSDPDAYLECIKNIYNSSGLHYSGILVAGKYMASEVNHMIGINDMRTWNEWRDLDKQLSEDLPEGILPYEQRFAPKSQSASSSPKQTVDYSNTQGQTKVVNSGDKKRKEPSWWEEFSNPEIVSMLIAFSLLLRGILWIIANFK